MLMITDKIASEDDAQTVAASWPTEKLTMLLTGANNKEDGAFITDNVDKLGLNIFLRTEIGNDSAESSI